MVSGHILASIYKTRHSFDKSFKQNIKNSTNENYKVYIHIVGYNTMCKFLLIALSRKYCRHFRLRIVLIWLFFTINQFVKFLHHIQKKCKSKFLLCFWNEMSIWEIFVVEDIRFQIILLTWFFGRTLHSGIFSLRNYILLDRCKLYYTHFLQDDSFQRNASNFSLVHGH